MSRPRQFCSTKSFWTQQLLAFMAPSWLALALLGSSPSFTGWLAAPLIGPWCPIEERHRFLVSPMLTISMHLYAVHVLVMFKLKVQIDANCRFSGCWWWRVCASSAIWRDWGWDARWAWWSTYCRYNHRTYFRYHRTFGSSTYFQLVLKFDVFLQRLWAFLASFEVEFVCVQVVQAAILGTHHFSTHTFSLARRKWWWEDRHQTGRQTVNLISQKWGTKQRLRIL